MRTSRRRYFEAGKWWLNDPDALVGNNRPVEGFRAWATLASVSGSVLTIGDDLNMLSAEKVGHPQTHSARARQRWPASRSLFFAAKQCVVAPDGRGSGQVRRC